MTQKHYNECDRCGAHYNAVHPKEVIFLRLPNKIIPAAKSKNETKKLPENGPLILFPISGINMEDLTAQFQPEEPEHTFVEFCPDCEISLISWFDVEWLKDENGVYRGNKHEKEYV